MKKHLHFFISIAVILFLIITTTIVILYGSGYRFALNNGKPEFAGTGLLVATSIPDGAEVYINDHLTTATNNTINLVPGEYFVRIAKEGYNDWQKKIIIQKEIVSKADAVLFPTAPKLESITISGVNNPIVDPSFAKIAYTVASESAKKNNGIYILDMNANPLLTLQGAAKQIIDDSVDNFSTSTLAWSPDGGNLLATISGALKRQTTYFLDSSKFNENPKDVTATIDSLQNAWKKAKNEKDISRLDSLKLPLRKTIRNSFSILAWSQDETKILYQASHSGILPLIIKPQLIGSNSTPQNRNLEEKSIYVYDIKEDKNYKITDNFSGNLGTTMPLMWLSDSKHLLLVQDKKIIIMDYDGLNKIVVYAGPFIDNFVFAWPNGSKIVILTNLGNTSINPNLYTVGLK